MGWQDLRGGVVVCSCVGGCGVGGVRCAVFAEEMMTNIMRVTSLEALVKLLVLICTSLAGRDGGLLDQVWFGEK